EEGHDAEDDDEEFYRDVNINMEGRDVQMTNVHTTQEFEDTHVTLTPVNPDVKVVVQIQSDRLRDEAQAKNEKFLSNLVENIQKIIKDQVKEQVKIILNIYEDTVTLKKHRDDADKDEEPYARLDWGYKRQRKGKEPESTSAPKEKATKTTGKSTQGSKSHQKTASESAPEEEPIQTTQDLEEPLHQEFKTCATDDQPIIEAYQHPECTQSWISDLAKQVDSRSSFNELMDTHVDFSAFLMNRLKVDTLTPELLAGQTYELMKGSCKSLVEHEFFLEEVYRATTE
nr:hypothetical protein [Tanacetum cinerariifolium]